ncbi:MAG: DEAD/DEAH box helicase [Actinomycetaceae bacterium]|nr:DEAD/DEAH box helicase [Actinomycetaceae bacterium]
MPDEATPDITDEGDTLKDLDTKSFADFNVLPSIVQALETQGITHPFPIQALTLPVALRRQDIIGQAKTGTGKTLGFAIPILHDIVSPTDPAFETRPLAGQPQALVILPTRELAVQVASEIRKAATGSGARITEVYGGRAFEPQIDELTRGTEVVVGTPGRMIDLMKRSFLKLSAVRTVVLDEADEMLDLGFLPDVETLLSRVPATRHTMLFSATMPGQVVALARRYMSQPTHIRAQDPTDQGATVKTVEQVIYRTHAMNKVEILARILQAEGRGLTIVFTRTKRQAAKVSEELSDKGFATASLHGDLGQGAREQALRAFRAGKVDVLVATDVAARGIDVDDVTHVVNYQCPEDEKTYLHRIGRTGRAGASGTALTFVDWEDITRWRTIDKALQLGIPDPVETYHTSEHLYTDLKIPRDVTGRLPIAQRVRAGLKAEKLEDLGETGIRRGKGHSQDKAGRGRSARRSGARRGGQGEGDGRGGSSRRSRNTRDDSTSHAAKTSTRRRVNRHKGRNESA